MAISNAVTLANIPSGDTFTVDGVNDRVGINSTIPTEALTVVGVVSATSFFGDGSNLDGVASAGLGTAISETAPGDVIYYTDTVLSIGATITIDAPSSSNVAYTQYAEIAVEEDKDLIIADGDDFIPDILGLSTEGVTPLVGAGGRIRADNFTNKAGNGAPNFPSGLTGTTGTFSGNVSIAGTLTYEDVTNVDSIGIITARSDISIADKIVHTGDTNTAIRFPAADTFTVETAGSEAIRVDSSGRLVIGSSGRTAGEVNAQLQVEGTSFNTSSLNLISNAGASAGNVAHINLGKSRGTSDGSSTVVASGDNLGNIQFAGADGTDLNSIAASISASVDGTPGTNNMPGRLIFSTTSDGSAAPTERLRITSGGTALFKGGLAEKYENAGTTLGAQTDNPLSDGNVILFTGNESSATLTINFTGVHSTLSDGETVSFTAIISPNGTGLITVAQVDGQPITIKWSGGSAPTAGASGQDIYTFQILKTGTGTSDYTVFGAAANYA